MQINGVGHNHSMHQVTDCMHNHEATKKEPGATAAASGVTSAQHQVTTLSQQPEGQFSLAAWLKNTLSDGRKLLHKIWGENVDAAQMAGNVNENVQQTKEQMMTQLGDPDEGQSHSAQGWDRNLTSQELAASAAVRQPFPENNPYFAAIEDTGREKQSIWEKVKVKFHSIAGQLLGRFSNKNSLYTKQEKSKEDLRKHSRYRKDDVEIDCILTDDSYLMDSYDRKGEYSKLSTKK